MMEKTSAVLPSGSAAAAKASAARASVPRNIFGGWDISMFDAPMPRRSRSEEHTSELQSLMRISYAVFCLKKKINIILDRYHPHPHNHDTHLHLHPFHPHIHTYLIITHHKHIPAHA